MLDQLHAYAALHWTLIMTVAGVWIFGATVVARGWPKPPATAPWYVRAGHFLFVDLPSLAATLNGKTWMGLTVSIPFVTWTVRPDKTEEPNARTKDGGFVVQGVLLVVALVGALLLSAALLAGCAPGTDGLRQACATEQRALSGAYESGAAWYRAKIHMAETLASTDPKSAAVGLEAAKATHAKLRAALAIADATAETQCRLADAIDAGEKRDVKALIAAVGAVTAQIADALTSISGAL